MFAEIRDLKEKTTLVVNLDKVEYFTMHDDGHYIFHFSEDNAISGMGEVTVFNYELKEGGEDETL